MEAWRPNWDWARHPPVVMVWCWKCRRYISAESRHTCPYTNREWTERAMIRRSKEKELGL